MVPTTEIPLGTSNNFEVLKSALSSKKLALVRAYDNVEKKDVTLICAVNLLSKEYEFIPLAVMIEEDPFERFEPPC